MSTAYYHIYDICAHCGRSETEDIGLASAGWKFLFQRGGWGYWRKRLETGHIEDEAGHKVSLNDLTQIVEEHQHLTSNHNCRGMRQLREDFNGFEYIKEANHA